MMLRVSHEAYVSEHPTPFRVAQVVLRVPRSQEVSVPKYLRRVSCVRAFKGPKN